jgi:cysteine desulfurase / selenocysteine lyase
MFSEQIVAEERNDFPITRSGIYVNVAERGPLSLSVKAAVDRHLTDLMQTGGRKEEWFATTESVRADFARLINAAPTEVAYVKNVSEGINAIANAFTWRSGDNVVIAAALEHPNNVFPWLNLRRLGVEVRVVDPVEERIDTAAVLALLDQRTRVVAVASATFAPGLRTDLDSLGIACRERDIFLLVDGAQSIGVLHTDVAAARIDGLVCSTSKGLLGVYGLGFLYCRADWARRLEPAYLARFGVDLGDAHESYTGALEYALLPDTRRFEIGNYNYAAIHAVEVSLKRLLRLGTRNIENHAMSLAQRLAAGLRQRGLPVRANAPRWLGSIVCVGGSEYRAEVVQRFRQRLTENHVFLSERRGKLRFSFHLYNTPAEVDRILDVAAAI